MSEVSEKKAYIDYLKAFAAVLVVLGHVIAHYKNHLGYDQDIWEYVITVIYAVHVPLFFAVSGYLCHKQSLGGFYRKKLLRIMLPFATFTVLKLLFTNVIAPKFLEDSGNDQSLLEQLVNAFVFGNLYWFCYAIIIIFLLAPLLWSGVPKGRRIGVGAVILLFICIALGIIFSMKDTEPAFVFQIGAAARFYPFFFGGYLYKEYEKEIREKTEGKIVSYVILLIGIIATVFYCYKTKHFETKTIYYYPLKIIAGFTLIALLYVLSKKLPETINFVRYIGSISLQIMLFDSMYRMAIFILLSKICIVNMWLALPITVLDVLMTCVSCKLIEKIPVIRRLFGFG